MDMRALAARRDVRWGGGAAAVVLVALLLGLTLPGGGSSRATSGSTPRTSGAPQDVATRWWSDAAAAQGSRIDEADPGAAANVLVPSQDSYCGILKQTLAAGRSILPQARAGDKALVASTKAFLAEIQSVAPPAVADDWKTLSPTLLALVSGHQLPANTSSQATANAAAAKAVAADAKATCGLTLSR